MLPWHEFYEKIIQTDKENLSDQEYFCLWCINASQKNKTPMSVHEIVMSASKNVYQSPIFEDELEIDYYLDQLKEKGYIFDPEHVLSFKDNEGNIVTLSCPVSKTIN